MIQIDITTPALLFPTISLLMLAYTNRHLALAAVIRQLHGEYRSNLDLNYLNQIRNLRRRMILVRNMQFFGVTSLLLCMLCMFSIFFDWSHAALALFSISMLSMMASLGFSLAEIVQSVRAIDLHLSSLETNASRQARTEPTPGQEVI